MRLIVIVFLRPEPKNFPHKHGFSLLKVESESIYIYHLYVCSISFHNSLDISWTRQAMYSSDLTINDRTYARSSCGSANYYYEAVEVNVMEAGYYDITSNSSMYTYGALYENKFDAVDTQMNLISKNEGGGCNEQFKISNFLQANTTYVLVVTTSCPNVTGAFSVLMFGTNTVSMNHIGEYFFQ